MKLAFIAPTAYLEKYSTQGDFYLALAHLLGDAEYLNFHLEEKAKGKIVYLDNGLFEGAQVTPDELINHVARLGPDVVCAPDVLYNSKATIKAFKSFIKLKQEAGLVCKVMGIPQADNPHDWWDCFQFFDTCKDCDMIGLSILSIPKSFSGSITESRRHVIKQLFIHSHMSGRRLTPMHLLGLGEGYGDMQTANCMLPREILSNDSSSAFVHGCYDVVYNKDGTIPGGKIKAKLDFDLKVAGDTQTENLIQQNINIAKKIAYEELWQ